MTAETAKAIAALKTKKQLALIAPWLLKQPKQIAALKTKAVGLNNAMTAETAEAIAALNTKAASLDLAMIAETAEAIPALKTKKAAGLKGAWSDFSKLSFQFHHKGHH